MAASGLAPCTTESASVVSSRSSELRRAQPGTERSGLRDGHLGGPFTRAVRGGVLIRVPSLGVVFMDGLWDGQRLGGSLTLACPGRGGPSSPIVCGWCRAQ